MLFPFSIFNFNFLSSIFNPLQRHIEFFHRDHFEFRYYRKKARKSLSQFIDFFWETDFEELWAAYPNGFADILFPHVGYTYMINLGTPFQIQLDQQLFDVRSDSFLPRYKNITTYHSKGNKIFGIKFKVSPIVFQKKINFAEYKEYIYPLAYLIDRNVVTDVKAARSFEERVQVITNYYNQVIQQYSGSLKYVEIVTDVLQDAFKNNQFSNSIELYAQKHGISSRTLQRYFEAATGINSKQALQMQRIRKAITTYIDAPDRFDASVFGYYDHSHFYKHIMSFLKAHPVANIQSHLELLKSTDTKINY